MEFKKDLANNQIKIITDSKEPIIWVEELLKDIGLSYKIGWKDQYCEYKRKPTFDGTWTVYYLIDVDEDEVRYFEFFEYLASFLDYQTEIFKNSLDGIEISYMEGEDYYGY